MANLFISHRGADKVEAELLADEIRARGHQVWLDSWDIKVGDSIIAKLNEGLTGASFLVLCYSAAGVLAPWISREWMSALSLPGLGAQRMVAAQAEQETIETSIRLSYELLDEELQKKWRSLAVFPSTFDRAAAAAVWNIDPGSADRALGELLRNSLVEWDGGEQRYHVHSFLRLFAESRIEASEQEIIGRRHALHYLEVLWATSRFYEQGGEALHQGLALFDREWDNIQAGHSWAVAHSSEDEEAAMLCSDYPHAGAYFLDLRRHPRERIEWLEPALEVARRLNDISAEAVHLGNLGNAYLGLGEVSNAATLYKAWRASLRHSAKAAR